MPSEIVREMLAEFLGTFVLIVFGLGVVAQTVLSASSAGSPLSINIAWGLAVTMGCYVAAGVTGAHLNPAVSLALAVHRRFPWRKVAPYVAAQMAGAFVASAVVFVTYHEALAAFDGGMRQVSGPLGTAGIWATYPRPFLSLVPGGPRRSGRRHGTPRRRHLRDHRFAKLSCARRSRTGRRRSARRADWRHVRIQLWVRHQPCPRPRSTSLHRRRRVGHGGLPGGNGWWWVPIVGLCVGAVAGGWLYDVCVGNHFPAARGASISL